MEPAPIQAGDLDYAIQYESFFFFLWQCFIYLQYFSVLLFQAESQPICFS